MKEVVDSPKTMRILQCLNWQLDSVAEVAPIIREQGFQAVQVGPLQPLKEDGYEHWWMSYQPCALTIGNQYGSRDDFIRLCDILHNEGLLVFPDVVCTHVAGAVDGTLSPHEKVDHKLTENPKFWREAKFIDNWDDRFQVIHYCAGLPTFDLSNTELQDYVICFLNDLISCGADGFRFDSAKSIPTPSEGCNFFPRVLSNLNSNHLFNYGEVIFADESLISMYTDYLDVLTNTWSECKDNVVLFSESHDSFLGLGYTRDKSSREVTLDYAHVVDNFPKTIYYARPFDDEWKSSAIKEIHQKSLVKK
ncbi:MAG: alpha-amylase family glycosyl hydrolase [Candidatus Faecimonas sp.]|nr:alpha-amylase family glycosyl hydrolase [Mycoplasmatota bacterium]MDY2907769.1 alpha-amylase family glycosyl hydrolase [Candidatus Faecimonas sp.]